MQNAFLLITLAVSHAENIWNSKVDPRGHKQTEDPAGKSGEEPQHVVQGFQKLNKVAL